MAKLSGYDRRLLEVYGWSSATVSGALALSHTDGSRAIGQAATLVLKSLRKKGIRLTFPVLPLGARFRYADAGAGDGRSRVWIKLSNNGTIAEYDPYRMYLPDWRAQHIIAFADTEEEKQSLEVILEP